MRQPSIASCSNCGCARIGTPCSVCGFVGTRRAIYPMARDPLTEAHLRINVTEHGDAVQIDPIGTLRRSMVSVGDWWLGQKR